MGKPNFDAAERKARELRLRQKQTSFALDIKGMTFDKPIVIDTYQNYAYLTGITSDMLSPTKQLKDGYTIISEDLYIVLYNDEIMNQEHLNWTLAHEIGHIYLEHTKDGSKEEVEAHWFAAELLAPEVLIRHIMYKEEITLSPHMIREMFEISKEASEKRYNTIKNKNICLSYLKKELIDKYENTLRALRIDNKKRIEDKQVLTIRGLGML